MVLYLDVQYTVLKLQEEIWAKVCRVERVLGQGQNPEEYQQLRDRRRRRNSGRNLGGIVRELSLRPV